MPEGQRILARCVSAVVVLLIALVVGSFAPAGAEVRGLVVVQPQPSGPPSGRVQVVGLGFEAGSGVEVRWNGIDGPVLASAVGPDFIAPATVPEAAGEGLHTVVVLSRDPNGVITDASATNFLVTDANAAPVAVSAEVPGSGPAEGSVPPTSPGLWAAVLAGLVVLGGGLGYGYRRRRRSSVDDDQ